ncbi:MAG: glycosyl hydrolase [Saprospiraceae bacterium]|nr:glycosyl hydrolase [Saprospiraceae bacterium]
MQMPFSYRRCLTILMLGCSLIALAQSIPANVYNGLQYRMIGPTRGGRCTAVSGVNNQIFTYYMGTTGGGVWQTTDGGESWKNISDGFFGTGSIGAIAVYQPNPAIIYVGTGSACIRGNVSAGDGIYKSLDGGKTWRHVLDIQAQIGRIVLHPDNPDIAYAAVLGNAFGPSAERGIYRTLDGGSTWKKVHFVSNRTGAIDLVMHPRYSNILFAGMWTAERKPWTLVDGSDEGGLWKSTDGGDTWTQVRNGLPEGQVGRIGITISPVNPDRMWVTQEAADETKGGLYLSEDGGSTWKRINRDHDIRQRAWYYSHIFAHPTEEHTLFLLNTRMWKSTDDGRTFNRINTPHGDNHDLWINPQNPLAMIESNDGGSNISFNGGGTWTTQFNQPTAEFYRVTTDDQFPYRVYGAQQDNTTISIPSETTGGLTPLQNWFSVGGGESGYVAVDPQNPDRIFAGNYIGQITLLDRSQGRSRDVVAYPQMHDGTAPRDIKYRFQWNAPIRISHFDRNTVYHCSQFVHQSTDGGITWTVISPDLTTNNDAQQDIPGGPIQHDHTGVELYNTIFAFEESMHDPFTLWAGSDDGLVHITRDGGKTWKEITPSGMPEQGTVNSIEVSPHSPGTAYIAVYKYRDNDTRPYVFRTTDFGRSWDLLTDGNNGIPAGHFVRVVREDPERQGLLYAGTEYGLYISTDNGSSWQSMQGNLPIVPITDLQVKGNDLVIATQGRSFWILDDLPVLRNTITPNQSLLPVPDAYRTQFSNRWLDAGAKPDPSPLGAVIYIYAAENVDYSHARLTITSPDSTQSIVFSAEPQDGEQKLTLKTGLNRFVWDLRYAAPKVQKGAVFSLANTRGIQAMPGIHTVQLTDGRRNVTERLRVLKDPRWSCSDADLQAEFELAKQCKAMLEDVHAMIGQIRTIRGQIKELEAWGTRDNSKPSWLNQSQQLTSAINDLEKQLIQTRSESGQDPINYPSMLDDQIAYLYSIVNGQDDRPTPGCYERYDDLVKLVAEKKTAYDRILTEVTTLNGALKQLDAPYVRLN